MEREMRNTSAYKNQLTIHDMDRSGYPKLSCVLLIIVIYLSIGLFSSFAQSAEEIGIVLIDKLEMQPEPDIRSRPVAVLKKGVEVKVLEHRKGWLKVKYKGQTGFIKNSAESVHLISVDLSDSKQDVDDEKIKQLKQEAKDITRKIEEGKAEIKTFLKEEVNIISSLDKIDHSLNKAQRRISGNRSQLVTIEKRISEAVKEHKELTKKIEEGEAYAAKRLVALYKINRLGKINILASAESIHDLTQRKKRLEIILSYDEVIRQNLIKDRALLKEILAGLDEQRKKRRAKEAEVKREIGEISEKKSDRQKVLNEIRSKRSLELAALKSLQNTSKVLDQTINSLTLELESGEKIEKYASKPFSVFKGLLNMPVKGKIISLFGKYKDTKLNVTNFRSGIDIKAKQGTKVHAVYAGRILYADWFKGYGNMIIIDHGGSYYTIYAHLEKMIKSKGDYVDTNEDIATAGDAGSMTGPKLHFEVRHHGKPLNPVEWLKPVS